MGKKISNDLLRRTEILARILNGECLTKLSAAEDYKVEEVTITRDLQYFRTLGLEIFSRKKGITLFSKVPKDFLTNFVSEYLSLISYSDYFLPPIKKFSKIDSAFFQHIVLLTKAINDSKLLSISYKKLSDNTSNDYLLKPLKLAENNGNWILHAFKNDETILKTFYLSRITNLRLTSKKFILDKVPQKEEKIFDIVLKFIPEVEQEFIYKIWFDEFELEKDEKGSILLKTKQPITNRLASWCISWWDAIEVLQPLELKDYIKEMIKYYQTKNL
ncbi:MAG: WYL domain-containing protein [Ignavibacteriaceae bacterium]|nr:WYL domain-containing protein [Ignavibacteriaceae bacterium]